MYSGAVVFVIKGCEKFAKFRIEVFGAILGGFGEKTEIRMTVCEYRAVIR